jgi:hypothetical protein
MHDLSFAVKAFDKRHFLFEFFVCERNGNEKHVDENSEAPDISQE